MGSIGESLARGFVDGVQDQMSSDTSPNYPYFTDSSRLQTLQLLLAQLARNSTGSKCSHRYGLWYRLERRRAIPNCEHALHIRAVEWRTGLDESLLGDL